MMSKPINHPLQLSKDYVKLRNIDVSTPTLNNDGTQRKSSSKYKIKPSKTYKDAKKIGRDKQFFYTMQVKNPLQYRFIHLYGKGDMAAGYIYYEQYWDKIDVEAKKIIKSEELQGKKARFAEYIKIDPTTLSQYARMRKINKKFWKRLVTMRKIVKRFDEFLEGVG